MVPGFEALSAAECIPYDEFQKRLDYEELCRATWVDSWCEMVYASSLWWYKSNDFYDFINDVLPLIKGWSGKIAAIKKFEAEMVERIEREHWFDEIYEEAVAYDIAAPVVVRDTVERIFKRVAQWRPVVSFEIRNITRKIFKRVLYTARRDKFIRKIAERFVRSVPKKQRSKVKRERPAKLPRGRPPPKWKKKPFMPAKRYTVRGYTIKWLLAQIVWPQAGKRYDAREKREERQRWIAEQKARRERQAVPKREREADIKAQRDKRVPDLVEPQFGLVLAISGLAALFVGKKATQSLSSASATLDSTKTLLTTINDCIKSSMKAFKDAFKGGLWLAPFVVCIYFLLRRLGVSRSFETLIVSVLISLLGSKVWSVFADFFQGGKENSKEDAPVETQAGGISAIAKLMSVGLCFSAFKGKASPSMVTEFCKRIVFVDRISTGFETFTEWAVSAVESFVNFVRERFGKDRITFFKDINKPTKDWMRTIDKYEQLHNSNSKIPDADHLQELVGLCRTGYGFREAYRNTPMAASVNQYIMRVQNLLNPYLGALNAENNFRVEPVAVMLRGDAGIGKTILAVPFAGAALSLSGILGNPSDAESKLSYDERVLSNIWQKGTSDFWNGYAHQACIVFDDAFQQRPDSSDKENEYMSLIRMVGSWSMPLNFADLESKGKIYFSSKMVFGTTNITSITSEAATVINHPEAVIRRLTFSYSLHLKEAYSIKRETGTMLDVAKYNVELARCQAEKTGVDRFPWYMWQCMKHDFGSGVSSGAFIPLRDVLMLVVDELKSRSDVFSGARKAIGSFFSGLEHPGLEVQPQAGARSTGESVIEKKPSVGGFQVDFDIWLSLAYDVSVICGIGAIAFVLGRLVITTLLSGLGYLIKNLLGIVRPGKKIEEQSNVRDVPKRSNVPKVVRLKQKPPEVVVQAGNPIADNIYSNTYKMWVVMTDNDMMAFGQVTFLTDTLAVMPEHFTDTTKRMVATGSMTLDSVLNFRNAINSSHNFSLTVRQFLALERDSEPTNDVEFIVFKGVRAHRNIVGCVMTETDAKYHGNKSCTLQICDIDHAGKFQAVNMRRIIQVPGLSKGTGLAYNGRRLDRYVSYRAETGLGDCGAPLCLLDASGYSGRMFVGFHVAGRVDHREGYSAILTQERVRQAMLKFSTVDDRFVADLGDRGVVFQAGNHFQYGGSFLDIGSVEKPVVICPKTSYYVVKSTYGFLGDYDYFPAPLSPVYRNGELVYPMRNALLPYSTPLHVFDHPRAEADFYIAMRKLTEQTMHCNRNLYTFDEAVLGIPQEKFRSIPRGTAAGFPYVYDVRNGKKEFFGEADAYDLTGDKALELRKRVDYIIENAKKNVRLSHVFIDFLKDELRSTAKVEAVATRLISSAPLDYTVAVRMLFGAFSTACMTNNVTTGMAPGVCMYSDGQRIVEHLTETGNDMFDGDFKAFDSSEQPCVHDLVINYINNWYGDSKENQAARKVLWLELVHSRHIGGNGTEQKFIYQWNKSLPSGHPLTTIVNSMYSLYTVVAAYSEKFGNGSTFWSNIRPLTYGDDNVVGVSSAVKENFNQEVMAGILADKFKMVYTSGDKASQLTTTFDLNRVTFLKRRFVNEGDMWVCPLDKDSFLYTAYWCKNRRLEDTIVRDVLETALEELSLHSHDEWNEFAPRIQSVMWSRGLVPKYYFTRDAYRQLVCSRTDNWY